MILTSPMTFDPCSPVLLVFSTGDDQKKYRHWKKLTLCPFRRNLKLTRSVLQRHIHHLWDRPGWSLPQISAKAKINLIFNNG